VSRDLLIAVGPGELRGVLVEAGRAVELRIERADSGGRVGELHLGRVAKLLPALPGALVEIGLERPALLSAEDVIAPADKRAAGVAAWLTEGQSVVVQVTREAQGDKAVSVSMRPRLAGRLLTLTPMRAKIITPKIAAAEARQRVAAPLDGRLADGQGAIIGIGAFAVEPDILLGELASLQARWQAVQLRARQAMPPARLDDDIGLVGHLLDAFVETLPDRIVIDDRPALAAARSWIARQPPAFRSTLVLHEANEDIFERHGVAEDIAAAMSTRIALPGAGALTIESAVAMAVIDVDAGDAVGGRGDPAKAILGVNLAAAAAAARQIRLRNLAGAIVIDFISMKGRAHRERVSAALATALADDPAEPQILGWTRLGHVELTRRRRHKPLAEILYEQPAGAPVKSALTVALEALREAARQAAHHQARAPTLIVHPAVAAALAGTAAAARRELESLLARPVTIVADPARGRETFDIRQG